MTTVGTNQEEAKAAAAREAFEKTFADVKAESSEEESELLNSSDDEEDRLARKPPGPPVAAKCTAAGPGVTGGGATDIVSGAVQARDADGRKVISGGATVVAKVVGPEEVVATVKDNKNGTYSFSYSVSKRGNFMVQILFNGEHIAGSPFPVFFGAPGSAGAAPGVPGSMGSSGVSDEELTRTLHVRNLSPLVKLDQLRQLFSFTGAVTDCRITGDNNDMALVVYSKPEEAISALSLNGMVVGDRALKVELAKPPMAPMSMPLLSFPSSMTGTSTTAPAVNLQLWQQMQLQQLAQTQMTAMAALAQIQVARAAMGQQTAAQKSKERLAELNKRLAGGVSGAADEMKDRGTKAPGRGEKERRRPRSLSPIRKRPRSRSPERSRSRRDRTPPRRDRSRHGEHQRRDGDRDHSRRDSDRRRDGDRDRDRRDRGSRRDK
eukprot:jgi/Chlat1/5166/Chrsp33S05039